MPAPLTPSSDDAYDWAVEELSRRVYSDDPTLWQIILGKIWDFISGILLRGGELQSLVMPIVLAAVVATVIILALVLGRNIRRGTSLSSRIPGALWDEDDERGATAMRAAAHEAAGRGDFSLAVIEAFRALVRSAEERSVAETKMGMTAMEAANLLGQPYPARRDQLYGAASLFNGALYGTQRRTEADFLAVVSLDEALLNEPSAHEVRS